MKIRTRGYAFVLPWTFAVAGCGGGGGAAEVGSDAGDAGNDAEAGVPKRVLVTANGASVSELVAVNVATKKVDGRLTFPGSSATTDAHSTLFPFLLEQSNSVVARLDADRPWVIDSSWNVLLNDETDGGLSYSNPYAVVIGAGSKAYVLRYNRNRIAVIDTSQAVEAGAPTSTIDLSSLVQSGGDGSVEMTSGAYVAAKNMLYVVLGNINQGDVTGPPNYDLLCTDTTSQVIGIDTTTDKVVHIGSGAGGSIALTGFDPVENGLVYDTKNDRLLVLEAGCNPAPSADAGPDASPGPISKRGVEAVNLADGSTKILLDASQSGYPSGFVYIDKNDAVLGFDFTGSEVYKWDPTSSKLGDLIPNAPDTFTYDGAGNLLGTVTKGTSASVVSVAIATGKSTSLFDGNPFTIKFDAIGGVDLWPHP